MPKEDMETIKIDKSKNNVKIATMVISNVASDVEPITTSKFNGCVNIKGINTLKKYIKPKDIGMFAWKRKEIDYLVYLYLHKHKKKFYFEMKDTIGKRK